MEEFYGRRAHVNQQYSDTTASLGVALICHHSCWFVHKISSESMSAEVSVGMSNTSLYATLNLIPNFIKSSNAVYVERENIYMN